MFSPESENDSNRLLHALLKTGVQDFKKLPEWVFKALNEDGYIEQESGTGAWFLSQEGKMIFRTPQKFQQYLITANEEEITPEIGSDEPEPTEFGEGIEGRPGNYPSGQEHTSELDEDMTHNSPEYNEAFKGLAKQIEEFEVHFGVNFGHLTINQIQNKAKSL